MLVREVVEEDLVVGLKCREGEGDEDKGAPLLAGFTDNFSTRGEGSFRATLFQSLDVAASGAGVKKL